MAKVVVIKNKDGSVEIFHPNMGQWNAELESEDNFVKRLADIVSNGRNWRVTRQDNIPKDRTFRGAWTDDLSTETVDVNIEKARAIHTDRLRAVRNEKLTQLDILYQRALEDGDEVAKAQVAARKKALRDFTKDPKLLNAATVEELAVFTLAE